MSVIVTESLRRAVLQAACLVRQNARQNVYQNARSVFTDQGHARAADASVVADVPETPTTNHESVSQKTIADLPGPTAYPVVGSAFEYYRKPNRGKMHEVQVSYFLYTL